MLETPSTSINRFTRKQRSPDGSTENEIDYISISQRRGSALLDVRACKSVDVSSDHHLLMAVVKLRLNKLTKPKKNKPFAVEKLKDSVISEKCRLVLQNRFQRLQDAGPDLEDQWERFKEAVVESAENTIGRKRESQREQRIQEPTWKLIDERKKVRSCRGSAKTEEEKERVDVVYRELDRCAKRSYRTDKRH